MSASRSRIGATVADVELTLEFGVLSASRGMRLVPGNAWAVSITSLARNYNPVNAVAISARSTPANSAWIEQSANLFDLVGAYSGIIHQAPVRAQE